MNLLQQRILDLVRALRRAGVPVSVSDDLDAMRAAAVVDLADRGQLREALAATTVKAAGHRATFDALFEVFFPLGGAPRGREPRDVDDFLADLARRVREGDDEALRQLAAEAVGSYGGVENRDGTTSYFAYRVFRQINLAGVLRRALAEAGESGDALAERLARDEFERRLAGFRAGVDAELQRRLVAARGPEEVARRTVGPLPEDVDFFRLTADEQAALRRGVQPLARKLATRLAVRRRRAADGRLDVRRTVRRSLSTGGALLEPSFRARRVSRPELVVLCDVSGSVSAFARFTLSFCHALTDSFSRVRSFAFIDGVDEVTGLFATGDVGDAVRRMASEADVVWQDGHSDYGHALSAFCAGYPDAVTPRSTLLVLGDARNNYRPANAWALAELAARARHTYWLNPEATALWGTGDSLALDYAAHVDAMVECRNLRQLAGFVESLA